MNIERIIVEVPELQRLEGQIIEANAVAEQWRTNQSSINTQIASARAIIESADADRKRLALAASLGDPEATGALAKARAAHTASVSDLADLGHALDEAAAKLSEAQAEAVNAHRALAKFEAAGLKRERVNLAGEIDSVIAKLASLLSEFDDIGAEIAAKEPLQQNMFGSLTNDGAIGLRRVRAALPKLFDRIFPNAQFDEQKKEALAISEARHWNLPPEQPAEEKAA
jgi:hypothetical protein